MENETSFEILHFSVRKWKSYHKQGCYKVNLVFRACDIHKNSYVKERFLSECEEWQEKRVTTDIALAEKYSDGLRMINSETGKDLLDESEEESDKNEIIPISFINDNGIKSEDVYIKAYEQNFSNMLHYNKKFDVFRFYEYFQINPVTRGIIRYIKDLQKKSSTDEYYAGQLLNSIKSLEYWWD